MGNHNVAHARKVTNAAFAKGTVPAPYYLFVLQRAQAQVMGGRLAYGTAVSVGAAGRPGGTVAVQRFTASHKVPRGATHAPAVPYATRQGYRKVLVPTNKPTVRGTRYASITVHGPVPVVAPAQRKRAATPMRPKRSARPVG